MFDAMPYVVPATSFLIAKNVGAQKNMKLTNILLLLIFIITGCVSEQDTKSDELPMFVGIENSKDYKLTQANKQFISNQTSALSVGKKRAAQFWIQNGFKFYHAGNLKVAMEQFNKAWLIDSDSPDIYWGYSLVLKKQSQYCDAMKTMDIAISKGIMRNELLSDTAFIISACVMEDVFLPAKKKAGYLLRAEEYLEKAIAEYNADKEDILRDWIRALSASEAGITTLDKFVVFTELTGYSLDGKPVDYLRDGGGSVIGFMPFDAEPGYGLGAIIDYGYTGLKHKLLIDPDLFVSNAMPNNKPRLDKHFVANRNALTQNYGGKEKRQLLNTIKQQLIDDARQLSESAKTAIDGMIDIEIAAEHAEQIIAADHKNLQYSLMQAVPPDGTVIRTFANNIDDAKKPLIIIGVDEFEKATITVKFDEKVSQDAKLEILNDAHYESVRLRMDEMGNLTINYAAPNIVTFRAIELDKATLQYYMTYDQLPPKRGR